MARVVFENFDPGLAARLTPGDVVLGGFNFGTGSSREQAVTALRAAGIALVIAGSFSQTYLRNAFNNGFPCVECPDLLLRARALFASGSGARAIVPGGSVAVDYRAGTITLEDERFRFAPLGQVPQALVVAGGIENQVRRELGLA
jgi:homoaconitate hydratase